MTLLVRHDKDTFCIFDSMGISEKTARSRVQRAKLIEFNRSRLQCKKSSLCGEMAMYFLYWNYLEGELCFEEIMQHHFTSSCRVNEERVKNFIRRRLQKKS